MGGSFRGGRGEDIWLAVLGLGGEDIWVAVLGLGVRIFGCQF